VRHLLSRTAEVVTRVMKNISRLTNPYFESGRDEFMENGAGGFMPVLPPYVLSRAVSLEYEAVSHAPWNSPLSAHSTADEIYLGGDGYGQLQGSNDGYSEVSPDAPGGSVWATTPNSERATSVNLFDGYEEPKKRYLYFHCCATDRHRCVRGLVQAFGRRGKLSCTQCRKIRSNVSPAFPFSKEYG
jgi:hypothetical protein